MNIALVVAIVVVAVIVIAGWWWYSQRQRREKLRGTFGPEYDRAVQERGSQSEAERELARREERVRALDIKPLSAEDQRRFSDSWRRVQARFVDDPAAAVGEADRLVSEVMQARGYPTSDFEQRAADVSVDHPGVVENYRTAHDLASRQEQGRASTEDLRKAMVHYRALFQDLLGESDQRQSHAA